MKIVGIIPARYASSRFPGKPLVKIAGKPLIMRVIEQCWRAKCLAETIVATDDWRIFESVKSFCRVEMTSPKHPSGTDRVDEVAAKLDCDAIVNVQGDEPLITPSTIDAVAKGLEKAAMTTAATRIDCVSDFENPNVVKVIISRSGRALLFSRKALPFLRDVADKSAAAQMSSFPFLKHLGIYGYHKKMLARFVALPESILEKAERLEQMRALENDISIRVIEVNCQSIGVDLPEDVAKVEQQLRLISPN